MGFYIALIKIVFENDLQVVISIVVVLCVVWDSIIIYKFKKLYIIVNDNI